MNDFLKIRKELGEILVKSLKILFRNIKFIWLFWIINVIFGIVLSIPFYYLATVNLTNSINSYYIASHYDFDWFFQIAALYSTNFEQYQYVIIPAGFVYLLIQLLLIGGIVTVYNLENNTHHLDFFYGSVRYFVRFFKVFLISFTLIILIIQLFLFLNKSISVAFLYDENKEFEFLLKFLTLITCFLLLIVVNIISDYTKVSLAILNKTQVLKQYWWTIKFIYFNFGKIFTTFIIVGVLGIFLAGIYNIVDIYIPKQDFYLIIIFLLQQALIVGRILIKLFFYSTQVQLYKDLTAEVLDFTNSGENNNGNITNNSLR